MIVDKRTDLAEMLADQNGIADLERTAGDEQSGARAEALLQLGLYHVAVRAALRIGHELKDFRLNKDVLKQRIHALPRDTGNRAADDVAAPILRGEALLLKLLLDAIDVCRRLVGLCNRDHDLNAGLPCDADALLGLGHDAVVGRNDENCDIGDLRTAGAHRAERRMAGSIEEGDLLAGDLDLVGADLLGDAAGLSGRDMLLADPVHESRLAVVDVSEERHDRGARLQGLGRILGYEVIRIDRLEDGLGGRLVASMLDDNLEAVLLGDLRGHVGLDALVDGSENLEAHQIGDQAVGLDAQLGREILHDDCAAHGYLARLLIYGNPAARLDGLRGLGRLLVEALLELAALLALASALVLVVVDADGRLGGLRSLRRLRRRSGGDGDRDGRRRLRLLERLEPCPGAKAGLRGGKRRRRGLRLGERRRHPDLGLLLDLHLDRGLGGLGLGRRLLDRRDDLDRSIHLLAFGGVLSRLQVTVESRAVGIDALLLQFAGACALGAADALGALAVQLGNSLAEDLDVVVVKHADRAGRVKFCGLGRLENRRTCYAGLFR